MTIDQFNFAGKKAFVRVDFNVPLDENFNITDDFVGRGHRNRNADRGIHCRNQYFRQSLLVRSMPHHPVHVLFQWKGYPTLP